MSFARYWRALLQEREAGQSYRRRRVLESAQGPEVFIDGRPYLNFCSNDYLGLANHPDLVEAMHEGIFQYGVGAGASHLVNGHMQPHHELEKELAAFVGAERALLFSTGYMANLGLISALVGRGDAVFEDRLNHASLIDAGLLTRAKLHRYPHGDLASLETSLQNSDAKKKLIVSDGVFSMDGDISPLPELRSLAIQHDALLLIDDAHGLGVLGKRGAGSCEHFGLVPDENMVMMGTLGKALGVFGAFAAGPSDFIEAMIQTARTYIYTTALPPAVAQALLASLRLVREDSWRRVKLRRLIKHFKRGADKKGIPLLASETAIQPVMLGENEAAMKASEELFEQGILVTAIRPPTVPLGTARLRVTLTATHEEAQVDRLLDVLGHII